jgi:hypothetical protein
MASSSTEDKFSSTFEVDGCDIDDDVDETDRLPGCCGWSRTGEFVTVGHGHARNLSSILLCAHLATIVEQGQRNKHGQAFDTTNLWI